MRNKKQWEAILLTACILLTLLPPKVLAAEPMKLAVPTELKWGVEYDVSGNPHEIPGRISYKINTPYGEGGKLKVYRSGENTPIIDTGWTGEDSDGCQADFFLGDWDSGTYYFSVQLLGDGVNYLDSETAVSDTWIYTKPLEHMGQVTPEKWEGSNANWNYEGDDLYLYQYEAELFFSETANRNFELCCHYEGIGDVQEACDQFNEMMQLNGAGYYKYKVRALSSDITEYQHGPWSEMSEAYHLESEITPSIIPLTKSMFTVDTAPETYDGTAKTKAITSSLTLGTDYTVRYSNNVNVGTATITITGKGDYSGTLAYTFEITNTTVERYSLIYKVEFGTFKMPIKSRTVPAGGKIRLTNIFPERKDYTFAGWADGTTIYEPGALYTMPERNVSLVAQWKPKNFGEESNPEYRYVQQLTKNSLIKANAETVETVNNALYNLIFKAQYRPTETRISNAMIPNGDVKFTGKQSVNEAWPMQNKDYDDGKRLYSITDSILGQIRIGGWGGCASYASFGIYYIYGADGTKRTCTNLSTQGIQEFIHKEVDPGEHLRYNYNSSGNSQLSGGPHSVIFLGETDDRSGFYYISYSGGKTSKGTNFPYLFIAYRSYTDFAKILNVSNPKLEVWQTNGGSYYYGTAKEIGEVRETNRVKKDVIRIACPVEATITLDGEILDSRTPGNSSFGKVERINNEIVFTLEHYENYELEIVGTGNGEMTLTAEYYTDDELIDTRTFVKVPIEADKIIQSKSFDPQSSFVLQMGKNTQESWGAGINETVYGPDESYSNANNGPDPEVEVYIPTPTPTPSGGSSSGGGSSSWDDDDKPRPAKPFQTPIPAETPEPTATPGPTVVAVADRFTDVRSTDWFARAVQYVCDRGMMNGMTKNSFSPNTPASRGMLVTILYRLEGEPSVAAANFSDVANGKYYANAVAWASANGLVNGFGDGTFQPDGPVTREQIAAILYRYTVYRGGNVTGKADLLGYTDTAQISPYAREAMAWARAKGLINGTDWGGLHPGGYASRAETAAILMRFCESTMK